MSKSDHKNPEKRYITLLGDPIHTNLLQSFVTAPDFSVMGLATAFTAAMAAEMGAVNRNELIHSVLDCSISNTTDIAVSRIIFEKMIVKNMAKLDPENSCIDLMPDFQTATKSSFKYKSSILTARNMYLAFLGATLAYFSWDCAKSYMSGDMSDVPDHMARRLSLSVRAYNGVRRFNRLAAGNAAIVDMPPAENVNEMKLTPV